MGMDQFRDDIRSFLAAAMTPALARAATLGLAYDRQDAAAWHRALFEQGWAAPRWPVEHGGTGWSDEQHRIFETELALAGTPQLMPTGVRMVGPVIYTFGTQEQKDQHLSGILDGSVWWCQGYSEPGSGSDLATVKTSAVRDGDAYVVNGQKIWTTNAHNSDWMFALVRTDVHAKPQSGISFLLIDMHSPGIEVRPIVCIDGMHRLNEVYFTDVRVPANNLVGEENRGWTYAKFLLGHERTNIAGVTGLRRRLDSLLKVTRAQVSVTDGTNELLGRLRDANVKILALESLEARLLSVPEAGSALSNAASLMKVLGTEVRQALDTASVELSAYHAIPFDGAFIRGKSPDPPPGPDHAARAMADYCFGRAASIYGGTNEIQRNVIAKSALGL